MPKLAQIFEESNGTRQVCVSVFFPFLIIAEYKTNRPHFDVIFDLLLNRRTATWNLFVK